MLNTILIFSMIVNLLAGFLLIAKLEPIVWGKRGLIHSSKTTLQDVEFPEWEEFLH